VNYLVPAQRAAHPERLPQRLSFTAGLDEELQRRHDFVDG